MIIHDQNLGLRSGGDGCRAITGLRVIHHGCNFVSDLRPNSDTHSLLDVFHGRRMRVTHSSPTSAASSLDRQRSSNDARNIGEVPWKLRSPHPPAALTCVGYFPTVFAAGPRLTSASWQL